MFRWTIQVYLWESLKSALFSLVLCLKHVIRDSRDELGIWRNYLFSMRFIFRFCLISPMLQVQEHIHGLQVKCGSHSFIHHTTLWHEFAWQEWKCQSSGVECCVKCSTPASNSLKLDFIQLHLFLNASWVWEVCLHLLAFLEQRFDCVICGLHNLKTSWHFVPGTKNAAGFVF